MAGDFMSDNLMSDTPMSGVCLFLPGGCERC
jgi:hypothetical protein